MTGPQYAGVREVSSNQEDIYKDLNQVVRKYAATRFLRPVAEHTRSSFEKACRFVEDFYSRHSGNTTHGFNRGEPGIGTGGLEPFEVILDSGCGTGESTLHIASRFPHIPVIGIDKSAARLQKQQSTAKASTTPAPENAFWVRAELLDFWKLALEAVDSGRWHIPYHALYYPNPWPKQSEATRRFHLHPIFPTLVALADETELRTNWEIYAREFRAAADILSEIQQTPNSALPAQSPAHSPKESAQPPQHSAQKKRAELEEFTPANPETAFERKYSESGQRLWKVRLLPPASLH